MYTESSYFCFFKCDWLTCVLDSGEDEMTCNIYLLGNGDDPLGLESLTFTSGVQQPRSVDIIPWLSELPNDRTLPVVFVLMCL